MDEQSSAIDRAAHRALRAGLLLSFGFLAVGIAWTVALRALSGTPPPRQIVDSATGAIRGDAACLTIGLLLLMLTPALRLMALAVAYRSGGDPAKSRLAWIVLGLLAAGVGASLLARTTG